MIADIKNALTVDVENWYDANLISPHVPAGYRDDRVVASVRELLVLLDERKVRATFFILGKVAGEHPGLIEEIAGKGHEIASHGWGHRLVFRQTEKEFEEDLARSLESLRRLTGKDVEGFRAPSWSVGAETPWFFDVLLRHGIKYDSSLFPVRTELFGSSGNPRHPHVIERAGGKLVEFPAPSVRLFGRTIPVCGGASLRLFPLAISNWGLERINREGLPAVVYLHPWELDDGIPFPEMPKRVRLMHSLGRRGMKKKLRVLLEAYSFQTLGDLSAAGCSL